jgi:membrane peptidoglycan carboxypeptidase
VRRLSLIFKFAVVVVLAGLSAAAIAVGIAPRLVTIVRAHDQTPITLPKFSDLAQRSLVYDAVGNEIAHYQAENTKPVPISAVSKDVIRAVTAVEDREFYKHKGVNLRSLVRAVVNNVQGAGTQGASTITQQVVKLEFLSGADIRTSGARYKLLQARYAVLLERQMTKDEIIARYLNIVYFGNNAYGIQAAAEVYFGKEAIDLNLTEATFLAGMIKSPSGNDPIRHSGPSRARFQQAMNSVAAEGLIDPAEAKKIGLTWALPERVQASAVEPNAPTHFTVMVRDYLLDPKKSPELNNTPLGATPQQRKSALYHGGLKIYTTLNPDLQKLAEDAKAAQLPQNSHNINAVIVSLDATSGALRAMVSGDPYQKGVGSTENNLAFDMARQTGSSIKLFILAAALEAGAHANDQINGSACTYPVPKDVPYHLSASNGSDGVGPIDKFTWVSTDCGYSRIANAVGINRVIDTATRMGIKSPKSDLHQTATAFAEGNNPVTPIDMASGAQTVANHGLHHNPYFIERIDGQDAKPIFQHSDPGTQVLDPAVADSEAQILKGVLKAGTARRVGLLGNGLRPSAGKTGTQFNNTNAWFVGFTPQLATAVWVGDPDAYTPMVLSCGRVDTTGGLKCSPITEFAKPLSKLGGFSTVQGATFPANMWKAYMDPANANNPPADWAPGVLSKTPVRIYDPTEECIYKASTTTVTNTAAPPPSDPTQTAAPPGVIQVTTYTKTKTTFVVDPNNLDPHAPLPTAPIATPISSCAGGPPAAPAAPKPKPTVPAAPPAT